MKLSKAGSSFGITLSSMWITVTNRLGYGVTEPVMSRVVADVFNPLDRHIVSTRVLIYLELSDETL